MNAYKHQPKRLEINTKKNSQRQTIISLCYYHYRTLFLNTVDLRGSGKTWNGEGNLEWTAMLLREDSQS